VARIAQAELAVARAAEAAHPAAAEAWDAAAAVAALRVEADAGEQEDYGARAGASDAGAVAVAALRRGADAERAWPDAGGLGGRGGCEAGDRDGFDNRRGRDAGCFDGRRRDFDRDARDRDERAARDANAWLEREEQRQVRDLGGRDASA